MQAFAHRRVTAARVLAGIGRKDLADQLDVHVETVGSYERGNVIPGGERLLNLANILGVEVGYFFVEVDEVA